MVRGEPFLLGEQLDGTPLGPYLRALVDSTGEWTVADVHANHFSKDFQTFTDKSPRLGRVDAPIWIHIPVHNPDDHARRWILRYEPRFAEYVDFYRPDGEGNFTVIRTGARRPFASRDIQHPSFSFELIIPPASQVDYYLRLHTSLPVFLEFTAWSLTDFQRNYGTIHLFTGLGMGASLTLAIFNLFLYFSFRESVYLFYVLSIAPIPLARFILWGLAALYFDIEMDLALQIVNLCFVFSSIFLAFFARRFLELDRVAPRLDRLILMAQLGVVLLPLPLTLVRPTISPLLFALVVALMSALLMLSGLYLWIRGLKQAKLYVMAFVFYFVGFGTFILLLLNQIEPSNWSRQGFMIGSVMEGLMLSLALADRINILRNEKELAQRLALQYQYQLALIIVQSTP